MATHQTVKRLCYCLRCGASQVVDARMNPGSCPECRYATFHVTRMIDYRPFDADRQSPRDAEFLRQLRITSARGEAARGR